MATPAKAQSVPARSIVMVSGRVISFVVRLMWDDGRDEHNVIRYDTAHGVPHRDTLGIRLGLLRKDWFPDLRLDAVLQQAIEDCKLNHENYIAKFKEN